MTTNRHGVFFTVDGRQPGRSEGLSVGEAARLLRDDYGVTDALSLDGGGSTTLAIFAERQRSSASNCGR